MRNTIDFIIVYNAPLCYSFSPNKTSVKRIKFDVLDVP